MDAPANTFLAYATAPGSVASDGDGANGLYTEHLLRELKVPEAKVEDVFKRVRLNVRRASSGAQAGERLGISRIRLHSCAGHVQNRRAVRPSRASCPEIPLVAVVTGAADRRGPAHRRWH